MTRSEMWAELERIACDWRLDVGEVRGNGNGKSVKRLPMAARAVFIRKMFAECVPTGHVAAVLNMTPSGVKHWYRMFRKAERRWFGHAA